MANEGDGPLDAIRERMAEIMSRPPDQLPGDIYGLECQNRDLYGAFIIQRDDATTLRARVTELMTALRHNVKDRYREACGAMQRKWDAAVRNRGDDA